MASPTFDELAARLDLARWESEKPGARSGFFACPVHGGSDSLHVTEKNGKALVKCFGCEASYGEIVAALDTLANVTIDPKLREGLKPRELRRETFDYGRAKKTRIDLLDGSKRFVWRPIGTKHDELMYGSADASAFDSSLPVVLVEGERKRDALKAAGFQSVSSAGGSSWKPTADALRPLDGFDVVLWPDADEPGRKVMDRVARALRGIAASVSVVEWPDAPEKGDAGDFLNDRSADEARALIDGATPWREADDDDYISEWASEVDLTPPKPLLLDYLEPDDYSVLFGDGGVGKGMIAAQWVADLTNLGWVVVLLDYEGNTIMEWIPRVARFGGKLDMFRILQFPGAIWDHADRVAAEIAAHSAARDDAPVYVVVDSIGYAVGDAKTEESTTAIRYKKALLTASREHPVFSLAHTTKTDTDARYPFGSKFWHNNVRHTIGVYKRGDGEDSPRVLRNRKVNRRAPFEPAEIDWSWVFGEPPSRLVFRAVGQRTSARVADVLAGGPAKLADIVAAVNADGDVPVTEAAIKKVLEREEVFVSDGKKPATYSVEPIRVGLKSVALGDPS